MLGLTYIYFNVISLCIFTDDHTGVYFFTGSDEECSTLLCAVETIGDGFTCFKGNERTLLTVLNISFVWRISVKSSVHNSVSFCVS